MMIHGFLLKIASVQIWLKNFTSVILTKLRKRFHVDHIVSWLTVATFFSKKPAVEETNGNEEDEDKESIELKNYIESILKPTNEDIDLAIQSVCGAVEKPKVNGFKSNIWRFAIIWPL